MKNIYQSIIGLAILVGLVACMTAGCSGGGDANKADANKPAPPANEKTVPGAPTSAQAK